MFDNKGSEENVTAVRQFEKDTVSNMTTFKPLRRIAINETIPADRGALLTLRLIALVLLVSALTMHVRSLRVFRWEQSVSGGVLVTYFIAMLGLVLCAGTDRCGGRALEAYICSTGAALLLVNAGAIWHRWHNSGELTRAVAELLFVLGVPLRRHVIIKVVLSAAVAVLLMLDLGFIPLMTAISSYVVFY